MSRLDTFKKQQALRAKLAGKPLLHKVVPQEDVDAILQCEINESLIRSLDYGNDLVYSLDANPTEIKALLAELSENFNEERFQSLLDQTQHDIIYSIATPFGLGKFVSAYDKMGGNITTIHNFEEGVTATSTDAKKYSEWKNSMDKFDRELYDYDIKLNKEGEPVKNKTGGYQKTQFNSTKKKEIYGKMKNGSLVTDGYTGSILGEKHNDKINNTENISIHLEHITSVKEIETNPKYHLFAEGETTEERQRDRVKSARNDNNLTLIEGRLNNSKGELDLKEWAEKSNAKDPSTTNVQYHKLNPKLVATEHKKSKDFLEKKYLTQQLKKQGRETVITGAQEGMKMGAQQAFGYLLMELFTNSLIEIKTAFNHGLEGESLHKDICIRLKRIGSNTLAKWKNSFEVGVAGLISGFISNIVTTLINVFATTSKRLVRMIREGLFSLLKALKTLLFPPAGMTYSEAAHEAMKLLVAGGLISIGIFFEEFLEKFFLSIPFLIPIAQILTSVIIGAITAIVTAMLVYLIDKLDIFNVVKVEEDKYILESLDNDIQRKLIDCERIAIQIDDLHLLSNFPEFGT